MAAQPPAMSRLRALAFNIVFWLGTVIFGIAGLPFLLTPRRTAMRFGRFWAQAVLLALKLIVGLDGEIRGRDKIPAGGCLIAMKHQSMWDTLMLPPLLGDPAVVIKRELQYVPFYGWYATRAGSIFIDRKGGAGALRRMVAAAKRAVAAGRPVVIFPQGTRTAPGAPAAETPYQPGIAALYRELAVPLVPAAVNSGIKFLGAPGFYEAARADCRRVPPADPARPATSRDNGDARNSHRDGDRRARTRGRLDGSAMRTN